MDILATTANNTDISISMAIMYETCKYKNQQNTLSSLQRLVLITVIPIAVIVYKTTLQTLILCRMN
jgi:hypothetical protein